MGLDTHPADVFTCEALFAATMTNVNCHQARFTDSNL